jgi:two-component system LytT family response regulator
MPELDGFGVVASLLRALGEDALPLVVFVTAYDEHALRAFEARAIDYLVKPFDDERLAETLRRARRTVRQVRVGAAAERLRDLLAAAAPPTPASAEDAGGPLDRIVLKSGGRGRLVRADSVDWIEAEGVYARLHVGSESFLLRMPMHELESRLDPGRFARIHRSSIVNLDRVREIREPEPGRFVAVLSDRTELPISRTRRAQLERRLGQSL